MNRLRASYRVILPLVLTFYMSVFLLNASEVAAGKNIRIFAPATPSSIPLFLAAKSLGNVDFHFFSNHSQAHALFLKDDVRILSTGLSVGVRLFRRNIPICIISTYVTGMSYLVTRGNKISGFRDLAGEILYLPFRGCPIEEITKIFIEREGLKWNRDIMIGYCEPAFSQKMLENKRIFAAVLPEPFASMSTAAPENFISLSYRDLWEKYTGGSNGYPQIGIFTKRSWAYEHKSLINQLNRHLSQAVEEVRCDPERYAHQLTTEMNCPPGILLSALRNTQFTSMSCRQAKAVITTYYQTIGAPLDESFECFFYSDTP
ncbi:MAG: hypothetical protein PHP23_14975 [Desulfobacterales bacterium]|nr:hypothetical protein [Desulfobacterales bacterium]MDD4072627.1 hypothetical protein [Desulfobacterales bacterium]MDD4393996.1 hypothetical protein [Desulfobacterales bacterium]